MERSSLLEGAIAKKQYSEFCENKIQSSETEDKNLCGVSSRYIICWYFMWLILGYPVLHNLIGTSLSEPHTSGKNGVSIAFVKIYVEIQINGASVM